MYSFLEILLRGHYHNFGAIGLEGFLNGVEVKAQCLTALGVDGDDAVIEGLVGRSAGVLPPQSSSTTISAVASPSWT